MAIRGWLPGEGPKRGDRIGPNPTDRAKNGVKRSVLVEAGGGPLSVVVAVSLNVPDAQLLAATIDAIILERPPVEPDYKQHLCLDKGYDNETGWAACVDHDYEPHIVLIRDERPARSSATSRDAGWSSAPWLGSTIAGHCSFAGIATPRTTCT